MAKLFDYLELDHIYSQAGLHHAKSISVCAANAKEGVTTIAAALALRCANAGHNTLLVDMNYCRPSLDRHFQMTRQAWILDETSIKQAIHPHISGLQVLTASLSVDDQLRQKDALQELMSKCAECFDRVIVDTSPLNAINRQNVPAEQVCAATDATLLVARTAVTKEADILQGLSRLKSYEIDILGWIMNDMDCPPLAQEIKRELDRLARFSPRIARWLDRKIGSWDLINQVT